MNPTSEGSGRDQQRNGHIIRERLSHAGLQGDVESIQSRAPTSDITSSFTTGHPGNALLSHANNMMGSLPLQTDFQSSIPWLSGPDAAAATSANIFEQFDIPFWMGDDQYSSLMGFDV